MLGASVGDVIGNSDGKRVIGDNVNGRLVGANVGERVGKMVLSPLTGICTGAVVGWSIGAFDGVVVEGNLVDGVVVTIVSVGFRLGLTKGCSDGIGNLVNGCLIVGCTVKIVVLVGNAVLALKGFLVGVPVKVLLGDRLTGACVSDGIGRFDIGKSNIGA